MRLTESNIGHELAHLLGEPLKRTMSAYDLFGDQVIFRIDTQAGENLTFKVRSAALSLTLPDFSREYIAPVVALLRGKREEQQTLSFADLY